MTVSKAHSESTGTKNTVLGDWAALTMTDKENLSR